jgi:hypothetical protein
MATTTAASVLIIFFSVGAKQSIAAVAFLGSAPAPVFAQEQTIRRIDRSSG